MKLDFRKVDHSSHSQISQYPILGMYEARTADGHVVVSVLRMPRYDSAFVTAYPLRMPTDDEVVQVMAFLGDEYQEIRCLSGVGRRLTAVRS